jgi:hypothetical protein
LPVGRDPHLSDHGLVGDLRIRGLSVILADIVWRRGFHAINFAADGKEGLNDREHAHRRGGASGKLRNASAPKLPKSSANTAAGS